MTPTPHPHQRGKNKQQEARSWEPGGRALGQEAAGPPPPPAACCRPPAYIRTTFPSLATSPGPAAQPGSRPACGEGSGAARRKGQPALDKARRSWVLLSAPLSCGLTFLLTACCSFHFVVWGFLFYFPRRRGGRGVFTKFSSHRLTVFTLADVNRVGLMVLLNGCGFLFLQRVLAATWEFYRAVCMPSNWYGFRR